MNGAFEVRSILSPRSKRQNYSEHHEILTSWGREKISRADSGFHSGASQCFRAPKCLRRAPMKRFEMLPIAEMDSILLAGIYVVRSLKNADSPMRRPNSRAPNKTILGRQLALWKSGDLMRPPSHPLQCQQILIEIIKISAALKYFSTFTHTSSSVVDQTM